MFRKIRASAKLVLATIAISCMALLLQASPANAAATTGAQSASTSAALLQAAGPGNAVTDTKPAITITRSTKASANASTNLASTPLTIFVVNYTNTTFDEVLLGVLRHSNPGLQVASQGPLGPHSLIAFQVDNCSDVRQYAFHVIDNGVKVLSSGDQVPNADDGDLCSDTFDIRPRS